jgi:hypothetical protein
MICYINKMKERVRDHFNRKKNHWQSSISYKYVIKWFTWENHLKGGKIYFHSQFQSFQPMVCWFHCFGPKVRQRIMAARACGRESCWSCDSYEWDRKEEEKEEEILTTRYTLQSHSNLLPPTKPYLLKPHSASESSMD